MLSDCISRLPSGLSQTALLHNPVGTVSPVRARAYLRLCTRRAYSMCTVLGNPCCRDVNISRWDSGKVHKCQIMKESHYRAHTQPDIDSVTAKPVIVRSTQPNLEMKDLNLNTRNIYCDQNERELFLLDHRCNARKKEQIPVAIGTQLVKGGTFSQANGTAGTIVKSKSSCPEAVIYANTLVSCFDLRSVLMCDHFFLSASLKFPGCVPLSCYCIGARGTPAIWRP